MIVPDWVRDMRGSVYDEYEIGAVKKYSFKQAAHILNVDYTTIKRAVRDGRLKAVRGAGHPYFYGMYLADYIIAGVEANKWHELGNGTSG